VVSEGCSLCVCVCVCPLKRGRLPAVPSAHRLVTVEVGRMGYDAVDLSGYNDSDYAGLEVGSASAC
jgi:hypothetical protein